MRGEEFFHYPKGDLIPLAEVEYLPLDQHLPEPTAVLAVLAAHWSTDSRPDLTSPDYSSHMRLISWNLLHGQSLPPSEVNQSKQKAAENLSKIAALVGADIFAVQEVDENQARSGEISQVKELAKNLGANYWAYARCVIGTPGVTWRKLDLTEEKLITNDSKISSALESSYGIGLISKVAVKQWHLIQLGRSRVGLPLGVGSEKGMRLIYVKDEPRMAIAAELENGYTVAVTHLSFVPLVNLYQLWRVKRWLGKLPGKHLLVGDLNLPFDLPVKFSKWKSLSNYKTYPSWDPKISFDYILADFDCDVTAISPTKSEFSDHLPVTIEIN